MNLIMKDHADQAWIKFVADDYARRVNCRTLPKRRVLNRTVTAATAPATRRLLAMAVMAGLPTILLAVLPDTA